MVVACGGFRTENCELLKKQPEPNGVIPIEKGMAHACGCSSNWGLNIPPSWGY